MPCALGVFEPKKTPSYVEEILPDLECEDFIEHCASIEDTNTGYVVTKDPTELDCPVISLLTSRERCLNFSSFGFFAPKVHEHISAENHPHFGGSDILAPAKYIIFNVQRLLWLFIKGDYEAREALALQVNQEGHSQSSFGLNKVYGNPEEIRVFVPRELRLREPGSCFDRYLINVVRRISHSAGLQVAQFISQARAIVPLLMILKHNVNQEINY